MKIAEKKKRINEIKRKNSCDPKYFKSYLILLDYFKTKMNKKDNKVQPPPLFNSQSYSFMPLLLCNETLKF